MLCDLAKTFPTYAAELLERDSTLTRNFREETVTDLLMASLIGLKSFGIRVQFPDETKTGGDMEWIFAAPLEVKGGRYLRLVLQAKRAQMAKRKKGNYWFYHHLDHNAGNQAQTLANQSSPGTLPLYIFYHPTSALKAARKKLPAVEGINVVFANDIAPVVKGGCGLPDKKVSRWRPKFLPLHDLLCWPVISYLSPTAGAITFLQNMTTPLFTKVGFHPDIVAGRLTESASRINSETPPIVPANKIPAEIQRAINNETTLEDRRELRRPRVILSTSIRRDDPDYAAISEFARRRTT